MHHILQKCFVVIFDMNLANLVTKLVRGKFNDLDLWYQSLRQRVLNDQGQLEIVLKE